MKGSGENGGSGGGRWRIRGHDSARAVFFLLGGGGRPSASDGALVGPWLLETGWRLATFYIGERRAGVERGVGYERYIGAR